MKPGSLTDLFYEHRKLAEIAVEVRFERDQVIFQEGEESSHLYVIVSGKVALEIRAPNRTILVQTLEAGDELGWSSVLPGEERHFRARALTPVRAVAFDAESLNQVCEEDLELGYALMHRLFEVVTERLEATRRQLPGLFKPAAARAAK